MAALTFYGDLMSQSCRAVAIFLRVNGIPCTEKQANLRKGSSVEEEQGKVTLLHVVPAINDNGFILTEGDAILKYLCGRYSTPSHWYPSDLHQRALIDEFCTWSNMNVHACAYGVYNHQVLEPRIKNIPIDHERLRRFQLELERGLDKLEEVFLKESDYVCGDDITIADILVACELMQATSGVQNIPASHPKLAAWLSRIEKRLEPHFYEVHSILRKSKDLRSIAYRCSSFDA